MALLVAFGLMLPACSSSDPDPDNPELDSTSKKFVGSWSRYENHCLTLNSDGTYAEIYAYEKEYGRLGYHNFIEGRWTYNESSGIMIMSNNGSSSTYFLMELNSMAMSLANDSFEIMTYTKTSKSAYDIKDMADNPLAITGTAGSVSYTYSPDEATLTLEGNGATPDYNNSTNCPFYNYPFKTLVVGKGVTRIGKNNFTGHSSLETVDLSNATSLISIGQGTFYKVLHLTSLYLPESLETIEDGAFRDCSNLRYVTQGDYSFNCKKNRIRRIRQLQFLRFAVWAEMP